MKLGACRSAKVLLTGASMLGASVGALGGCVVYCADPTLYYFTLTSDNNEALLDELAGDDTGGGDTGGEGDDTGGEGDDTGGEGDDTGGEGGDTGGTCSEGGDTGGEGEDTGGACSREGDTGGDTGAEGGGGGSARSGGRGAASARHHTVAEDGCVAACEVLMAEAYGYGTVDNCEVTYDAGEDSYTYACLVYDGSCK